MSTMSCYQPISALDLLNRFRNSAQARRAFIAERVELIRSLDPVLKAMTATLDIGSAISASDAASGPLHGLPLLVKDIFDTHDLPTAYGSPIYAAHQPAADAALVTLVKRRGGVVLGKTVTCEFAYMSPAATHNPFDLERTPGGSSAGSAAAVAAGYAPFAIGTQTGGSTIRPASFCGIAGYKPSFGLLPTAGMKCFSWTFDTVGLFACGVRDLAYLADALSGQRPSTLNPAALTFGVPDSYPWTAPSDNAVAVLDTAIRAIERAGGHVRTIRFEPWMAELIQTHATIQSYEACQTLGFEYDRHRQRLSPMLRDFLDRAAEVTPQQYREALAFMQRVIQGSLPDLFAGIDAVLTPSAPDEAPVGLESTGDPAFNRNWTLLGTPCVSIPGLTGVRGGHIGVQLIGARGEDTKTLSAAAFLEKALETR
jgi:Asp-tRNA(Asn)/Glu-tRNA(Gln) amidotransferase A subunit family amidase